MAEILNDRNLALYEEANRIVGTGVVLSSTGFIKPTPTDDSKVTFTTTTTLFTNPVFAWSYSRETEPEIWYDIVLPEGDDGKQLELTLDQYMEHVGLTESTYVTYKVTVTQTRFLKAEASTVLLNPFPENVLNLAYEFKAGQVVLSWNPAVAINYSNTELKVTTNPLDTWDSLELLPDRGYLWSGKASEFSWARPLNNTYYIFAKHKDVNGIYSYEASSVTFTVTDAIDGDNFKVELESSQGNIFKTDQNWETVISAKVYLAGQDVTSDISASRFKWTRSTYPVLPPSGEYPGSIAEDLAWNNYMLTNPAKSFSVTDMDILQRVTYFCEILSE